MRLLVIDPDRHLSDIVRSVMTGEGHDVTTAENGEQALRAFREEPADLILGLMELGDEDGVSVLRQIRAQRGGDTVGMILMSGYRRRYDRHVQDAMAELGARDFLRHPFSVLDLVDMLRRIGPRREPRSRAAAPPPTPEDISLKPIPRARYSSRNLNALARLWSSSASGILHVENAPSGSSGGVSGWVTLQNGGPAHANDWELIRSLLQGGEMNFERAGIEGSGDRTGLGRLLYFAVFDESKTDFAELHRFDALLCTEPLGAIASLPISDPVLTLLRSADGSRSLGALLAESEGDPGMISAELCALRQLQMVVFQSPLARTSGSGASIKRARLSSRAEADVPLWQTERKPSTKPLSEPAMPSWMSDEPSIDDTFADDWMEATDVGAPAAPVWLSNEDASLDAPHQPDWLDDASEWSSSVWTQDAPQGSSSWLEPSDTPLSSDISSAPELPDWMRDADLTSPSATDSQAPTRHTEPSAEKTDIGSRPRTERSRRTPRSRLTDQLRERRAGHWRRHRSSRPKIRKPSLKKRLAEEQTQTDVRQRRLQDPEALRRIFTRELDRLRSAEPAVVLGIPADSKVALITQSARRLRHRYKTVADDRRMPEDVRLQAEELKSLVYTAYKTLKRGGAPRSVAPEVRMDDVDWLLKEGSRLLAEGKWSHADQVLSRAHRIRIDHPAVLSSLGWARYHNTNRPAAVRADEACDLLGLAIQFEPDSADARYYLAMILMGRDELELALRHASFGVRLNPQHEALALLVETLEARAGQP